MALSNIRREPRREITESVIGILVAGGYMMGDWFFVAKVLHVGEALDIAIVMLLVGIMVPIVTFAALIGTHAIGEIACDLLRSAGIDPRPKQRWS